jgi:hypothetical protein
MQPRPQSHKEREAISDACLHVSHSGLFTSPNLNRCPFRWRCPVNSPVNIHSWFLLKLSSSPALLAEGLLRKPLACLCPRMDCQYSVCFLFVHPLITSLAILADMPRAGSYAINGHEEGTSTVSQLGHSTEGRSLTAFLQLEGNYHIPCYFMSFKFKTQISS